MSNFTRKKSVKFGTRYLSVEWVKQKFLLEEIDRVNADGKFLLFRGRDLFVLAC